MTRESEPTKPTQMKPQFTLRAKFSRPFIFARFRTRPFALALSLALASAFALTACHTSAKAQESGPVIRFVRNPDAAPDFKLTSLDGKPLSLADSRGKVILLNFWATWCGPCRAEIPDLIELQNKYKDHLQIIGLSVDDDDPSVVKDAVAKTGINYPVAVSPGELRMKYGGIGALPTSFVLDAQGRVVQKHEGLRDPILYETEIRALLGMPISARVETFEDTGQVFLAHANRASALPGVDMSKLSAEQKQAALHAFNAEACTCGCGYTLAQCRIYDHDCAISKARTGKIIADISGGAPAKKSSTPPAAKAAPLAQPNAPPPQPTAAPLR
jgi:thiol-disulfide isomerase/thioredoxin